MSFLHFVKRIILPNSYSPEVFKSYLRNHGVLIGGIFRGLWFEIA